jgi:hypothetical protein
MFGYDLIPASALVVAQLVLDDGDGDREWCIDGCSGSVICRVSKETLTIRTVRFIDPDGFLGFRRCRVVPS